MKYDFPFLKTLFLVILNLATLFLASANREKKSFDRQVKGGNIAKASRKLRFSLIDKCLGSITHIPRQVIKLEFRIVRQLSDSRKLADDEFIVADFS